jgi:hypothetical protein
MTVNSRWEWYGGKPSCPILRCHLSVFLNERKKFTKARGKDRRFSSLDKIRSLQNTVTYSEFAWLITVGSGLDDCIYWHFFTITINCDSSQSTTVYDSLHSLLNYECLPSAWLTWFRFTSRPLLPLPLFTD